MPRLRNRSLFPLYWIMFSAVALGADYASGPFVQFPIFFFVPVVLASWYSGRWWGGGIGIVMCLGRAYFVTIWPAPWTIGETAINTGIRMGVLTTFAFLVHRTAEQSNSLRKEVQILEGLLPVCSFCKRIRTSNNEWQQIEEYVSNHSHAEFTHGLCPECTKEHYGDLLERHCKQTNTALAADACGSMV